MAEDQTNHSSKRLIIVAAVAILALIGISIFLQPKEIAVQGQDEASQQQPTDQGKDRSKDEVADAGELVDSYTYTAVAGDSYTQLARQAVAALAGDATTVERVAAETKLAQDAGAPLLEIGQQVELSKSTIQAAIDWAVALNDAEKNAWQPYADMVILPEIK